MRCERERDTGIPFALRCCIVSKREFEREGRDATKSTKGGQGLLVVVGNPPNLVCLVHFLIPFLLHHAIIDGVLLAYQPLPMPPTPPPLAWYIPSLFIFVPCEKLTALERLLGVVVVVSVRLAVFVVVGDGNIIVRRLRRRHLPVSCFIDTTLKRRILFLDDTIILIP